MCRHHIKIDPGAGPADSKYENTERMNQNDCGRQPECPVTIHFGTIEEPNCKYGHTRDHNSHFEDQQGKRPPNEDLEYTLGQKRDFSKEQYPGAKD